MSLRELYRASSGLTRSGEASVSMKRSPYVFITHSSKDRDIADNIRAYLEANGIGCWIAPRDIPVGEEWAKGILNGINGASGMLLVLSENSNDSPQVRREIERAIHNNLPIFPVRIEDIEPLDAMEYYISSQHWMDLFEDDFEQAASRLTMHIKNRLFPADTGPDQSQERPKGLSRPEEADSKDDVSSKRSKSSGHSVKQLIKYAVPAAFIAFVAFLLLSTQNQDSVSEGTGPIESQSDPGSISVVFGEADHELSCESIQPTLDGGIIMTGKRTPLDTSEVWSEIWIKKLDESANEEWEYTIRDSLGDDWWRSMTVTQTRDSSYICAYELPMRDSLLPESLFTGYARSARYSDIGNDNGGCGCVVLKMTPDGTIEDSTQLRFPDGAWESCRIHSLMHGPEVNIPRILMVASNVTYEGARSFLLSRVFSDSLGITALQSPGYEAEIQMMADTNANMYHYILHTYNGLLIYHYNGDSILTSVGANVLESCSPQIDGFRKAELLVYKSAHLMNGVIYAVATMTDIQILAVYDMICCHGTSGELLWQVSSAEFAEPHGARCITLDRPRPGGFAFCGEAVDSSYLKHPCLGMLSLLGRVKWYRRLPIIGVASDICRTNSGLNLLAIERDGEIVLVSFDPSDGSTPPFPYSQGAWLVEDWEDQRVARNHWAYAEDARFSETETRGVARQTALQDIVLLDTLVFQPGLRIDTDVFIERPLHHDSRVRLVLERQSDTIEAALAEVEWSFGMDQDSNYEPLSISAYNLGERKAVFPDSSYIEYGAWNRLTLSVDSSGINYMANERSFHRESIDNGLFGDAVQMRLDVFSGVPVLVDSMIINL